MRLSRISIQIIAILFWCPSCNSTIACLAPQREALIVSINSFELAKDSIINMSAIFLNNSSDTLILPKGYLSVELNETNSELLEIVRFSSSQYYPEGSFNNYNRSLQKEILLNNCRPLANSTNFAFIPPNDSLLLTYNIPASNYYGWEKGMDYNFTVYFECDSVIREYCPLIWYGKTPVMHVLMSNP